MKKVPLTDRVNNYILWYGRPKDGLVPMHPGEYLDEKSTAAIKRAEKDHNVSMFPLGMREYFADV